MESSSVEWIIFLVVMQGDWDTSFAIGFCSENNEQKEVTNESKMPNLHHCSYQDSFNIPLKMHISHSCNTNQLCKVNSGVSFDGTLSWERPASPYPILLVCNKLPTFSRTFSLSFRLLFLFLFSFFLLFLFITIRILHNETQLLHPLLTSLSPGSRCWVISSKQVTPHQESGLSLLRPVLH